MDDNAPDQIRAGVSPDRDGWYQCINTTGGEREFPMTAYVRKDLHDAANARIAELEAALTEAHASCSHDLPEYHDEGMGCGLEDRNITDRYEAMAFGWEQAMGRVESEIISHTQEILTVALNPTTEATQ
jgi:hypothetical protein